MSAPASDSMWRIFCAATAAEMPFPATCEETSMRRTLATFRDTLLVLVFQVAFRATLALRSLNY